MDKITRDKKLDAGNYLQSALFELATKDTDFRQRLQAARREYEGQVSADHLPTSIRDQFTYVTAADLEVLKSHELQTIANLLTEVILVAIREADALRGQP